MAGAPISDTRAYQARSASEAGEYHPGKDQKEADAARVEREREARSLRRTEDTIGLGGSECAVCDFVAPAIPYVVAGLVVAAVLGAFYWWRK